MRAERLARVTGWTWESATWHAKKEPKDAKAKASKEAEQAGEQGALAGAAKEAKAGTSVLELDPTVFEQPGAWAAKYE